MKDQTKVVEYEYDLQPVAYHSEMPLNPVEYSPEHHDYLANNQQD